MRRERDQVRSSVEISVRQHCCCVLNYYASTITAHHYSTYSPSRRGGTHSQPPHAPRAPRAAPTPTPTPAPRGAASVSVSVRFLRGYRAHKLPSSRLGGGGDGNTSHTPRARTRQRRAPRARRPVNSSSSLSSFLPSFPPASPSSCNSGAITGADRQTSAGCSGLPSCPRPHRQETQPPPQWSSPSLGKQRHDLSR